MDQQRSDRGQSARRDNALDLQIAEMRRILAAMKQESAAEALRMLRERYPDVPLQDRVRAVSEGSG